MNAQENRALDQRVADGAGHHDRSAGLPRQRDKGADVEPGDGAGLAEILHRLGRAAEPRVARRGFGRARGGGRIVEGPEHVADDGAPLVADQMKHVADLKVAEALHQPREHEHAGDDHDSHERRREQRDLRRSPAVHPDEREEGVDEGCRECAERMKHHAVAREPKHQPRRIGDRAELHHHEGHGEDDPGQRHHSGRRGRKVRLGRGYGHVEGIVRKVCPFEPRQREPGKNSRAHVEHRNEPGLHRRPTRMSSLRSSPISWTMPAVYGIR